MMIIKTANKGLILFISGLLLIVSCGEPNQQVKDTGGTQVEDYVQSPKTITYKITGTLPHDSTAFTQGLEYADGMLYESTGLQGANEFTDNRPSDGGSGSKERGL